VNAAQRKWLAGSLIAIGLSLIVSAFKWDSSSYVTPIISVRVSYDFQNQTFESHGIFVRDRFRFSALGQTAIFWGGVLPLCLFTTSGFVLLGQQK
jgi:hypothetical protein